MKQKLEVKFRLRPRRAKNPVTGEIVQTTKNVLITMRVYYAGLELEFTTGYHVNVDCWDAKTGVAIYGCNGMSADDINNRLAKLTKYAIETVQLFRENETKPTAKKFKEVYFMIKDGITPTLSNDTKDIEQDVSQKSSDNTDTKMQKQDTKIQKQRFNKISETSDDKENNYKPTFWEAYHEYEAYAGKLNDWAVKTRKKYETIRYNLKSFRDWKRKNGLPNFNVTFEYLDEDGLQSFIDYLRTVKKYVNTTIRKDIVMLKVVLRWAYRKQYHDNNRFEAFKPALKSAPKKVIFFNKRELEKLESFEIPEAKLYLVRVRDVFLFQCYTGIRYSDLANLRRCDVHDDCIEITTIKTVDSLKIELNKHSKAILKKYEPFKFKDDKALPVISNQKMNDYLHELCKLAGFDEQIRITYFRGNERFDEIKPKYELIGSHTGRRSFICNALSMGISPQVVMKWTGHSDYKAMKPYIDVADEIKAEAMKKFNDF